MKRIREKTHGYKNTNYRVFIFFILSHFLPQLQQALGFLRTYVHSFILSKGKIASKIFEKIYM